MTHGFSLELVDRVDHHGLPALRELLTEYQEWLGISLCFQGFDNELASLPGSYAPPQGRLYLARVGPQSVGCVGLRPYERQAAEMKRLYLRPTFQGQGLGRILAERVIEDARRIGYHRVLLDTLPVMHSAQALYEKLGFEKTDAYVFNPVDGVKYLSLDLAQ